MNEFLNELRLLMVKHDVYIHDHGEYSDRYIQFEQGKGHHYYMDDESLLIDGYQDWVKWVNSRKEVSSNE